MRCIATLVLALMLAAAAHSAAPGQEDHARFHSVYKNWINRDDRGCCNDQDCGQIADSDERTGAAGTEVRVEGQWCPVLPRHYLKTGNAPNWSSAHICVLRKAGDDDERTPCERFICYQPKPQF